MSPGCPVTHPVPDRWGAALVHRPDLRPSHIPALHRLPIAAVALAIQQWRRQEFSLTDSRLERDLLDQRWEHYRGTTVHVFQLSGVAAPLGEVPLSSLMPCREVRDRVSMVLLGGPSLPPAWSLVSHTTTLREETWPEATYGTRPAPHTFPVGPLPMEDPD